MAGQFPMRPFPFTDLIATSGGFELAKRLGKMKTNILTLVLALIVITFLGIRFSSLPWTPRRIVGVAIGLPSVGASGIGPN